MLLYFLITPILMILLGYTWMKRYPSNINKYIGYRTRYSMMNLNTWKFSHKFITILFIIFGIILLILIIILNIKRINITYIIILKSIFIFLPILITEILLRIFFDKNGNKKNNNLNIF